MIVSSGYATAKNTFVVGCGCARCAQKAPLGTPAGPTGSSKSRFRIILGVISGTALRSSNPYPELTLGYSGPVVDTVLTILGLVAFFLVLQTPQ